MGIFVKRDSTSQLTSSSSSDNGTLLSIDGNCWMLVITNLFFVSGFKYSAITFPVNFPFQGKVYENQSMYLSQADTLENTPVNACIDQLNLCDNSGNSTRYQSNQVVPQLQHGCFSRIYCATKHQILMAQLQCWLTLSSNSKAFFTNRTNLLVIKNYITCNSTQLEKHNK